MQLGSVITQGNRPIVFFNRKLSVTRTKYSVTKIKLVAIVETLKELRGMLWGQTLKVFTDHKNLTQHTLGLTSDRVYHWQLLLEEFAPEIVYIKGIHNMVADAIPRLDYNPEVNPISEFRLVFILCGPVRHAILSIFFFQYSTSLHNILSNFFLTIEQDTSVRKKLIFPPIIDGFKKLLPRFQAHVNTRLIEMSIHMCWASWGGHIPPNAGG